MSSILENRYEKYAICIIIIGIIIRFSLALISYPSGDACWHLAASEYIAKTGNIPLFETIGRNVFWAPPLFHIMSAGFYLFFGLFDIANIGIKLVSPIAGSLFVLMSFLLTRKLFGSKTAFFTTVFIAFIPESIYSSAISYVDMLLALFVICSVYFAFEDKTLLTILFSILSIFTKYSGVFVIPPIILIIYYRNPERKKFMKNALVYTIPTVIIGSIWFIRNWVYLQNPIWPFLNSIFNSSYSGYDTANILNFFIIEPYKMFYLSLFGVPSGNAENLLFLPVPFLNLFLFLWLTGTILFLLPLIIGISKINLKVDKWKVLVFWFVLFLLFGFIYILNTQSLTARLLLPAFLFMGILWSLGFEWMTEKLKGNYKIILKITFVVIIIGIVSIEFFKAYYAGSLWTRYQDDFYWVISNTPEDSIFLVPGGQCYSFNIERPTVEIYENGKIDMKRIEEVNYVWVNANMLPRGVFYPYDVLNYFESNMKLVYENNVSGTKIYEK